MIRISIRTRVLPIIFLVGCGLFAFLFSLFYNLIFRSIDEIFARQSSAITIETAENVTITEEQFRRTSKKLHTGRGIQRLFSQINTDGLSHTLQYNLQEILLVWFKQQAVEYTAATYLDNAGTPIVAIRYNTTIAQNDVESLAQSTSTEGSPQSFSILATDPEVIQTWQTNNKPIVGTYALKYPDNELVIRSVFPILDRKTREENGFFAIDRPLKDIIRRNVKDGEALIVFDDDSDRIIYDSSNIENSNLLFTDVYSDFSGASIFSNNDQTPTYAKATIEENEILFARQNSSNIGWNFIHSNTLNPFLQSPKERGQLLVVGALFFVILTGGAIYTLTKRVQRRSSELEEANEVVSAHSKMLEQELQTAHDMQMRLMPQENPVVNGYQVVGKCRPATEVGGDFFQYFNVGENKWTFALADVTGHGMQAAVPTMVFSGLLDAEMGYSSKVQESGRVSVEPEKLMGKLNTRLCRFLEPRTFVCLSLGELDTIDNTIRISNGGCPYPYVYRAAQKATEELDLSAFPLGVRVNSSYKVSEVSMKKGDVVVFCSDGIMEASSQQGQLFGFDRVSEIISEAGAEDKSAEQIIASVFSELDEFSKGCEQDDDQTIVVVKAA